MRNPLISLVVVVLAVAAFSCGGSSPNGYTCNYSASVGICAEWSASQSLTSQQVTTLQNYCTAGGGLSGTFSTGMTCPSASRVGICTMNNTQVNGVTFKLAFYGPTYTAATGQLYCGFVGTWTAG
jgi:hypothetical protein